MADAPILADPTLGPMPIGQRLRDMRTANRLGAGEIGDRPCDPYDARSASPGKPQSVHGLFDQFRRIRSEPNRVGFDLRIARRTVRSMAVTDGRPGALDSFRDHRAGLAAGSMSKFGGGSRLNFHREVDPIEDGTADTVALVFAATRSTTTFPFGVAEIPAPAWIHRRHELEARRIGYVSRRPGHGGSSRLHRLAQCFQRLAWKFWQFIEK